jgi:5,10-methylenetetrahydrofolate reductase
LSDSNDQFKLAIEVAVKQIEQLAEQGLDQVLLYTLNRPQWVPGILHALKPAKLAKSA